jgi:hypothetical protein
MSRSPMLIVDDATLRYGRFRHYIIKNPSWDMLKYPPPDDCPDDLVRIRVCDTELPAYFCTCGLYMLFEQD